MSSATPPSPKKKVTLYFSSGMLDETQHEAIRQDRSISWIIQAAWRIAREDVRKLPAAGIASTPVEGVVTAQAATQPSSPTR